MGYFENLWVRGENLWVTLRTYGLEVPLWANFVVTLLVNSRGWSSLRVVFSQKRNFTVIVSTDASMYAISIIYHLNTLHLYPAQTRKRTKKELPNSYIKL